MIFSQILSKILSFGEAIHHKLHPKATYWSAFLSGFSFLIICLVCCSCGSTKVVPIETIHTVTKSDTLYKKNVQYDSIYVSQKTYTDRTKDTILIRQHDVEYRYKLLRDTIYKTKMELQRDSIPYEVRITEVQEVKYIPLWCKLLSWTGGIFILLLITRLTSKIKRLG